jgi:putative acyl-CoA dehydrogenase
MQPRSAAPLSNQPPALADYNLFTTDTALAEAVERGGAGWAFARLEEFGRAVGTEEAIRWGFQVNEYPPVLETHDRFGNRRDEVEFHPAWHELMRLAIGNGLHSLPWTDAYAGAHVARAALMMLGGQNEAGHMCPVSMTYSAVPTLRSEPEVARDWEPHVLSTAYDSRFRPRDRKAGALIGMAMTEKQGGSDLRANITTAEHLSGAEYRITGHKWFCSAPMSDAFLVLAQAPGGLTCFLLPRWTPDERPNAFHIQRLKRKLGNRSNASSEVEFDGAWARRIGEEGRGIATIMDMVQHTRLDCCIGSAAIMRRALVEAIHHARHRAAFAALLIEKPLMRAVLADLAIESEAATLVVFRLARAFEGERAFARLATAVSKYWICKRASPFVSEALECLGGNGYVEESMLPRLYREAPLNSIWEGSGNVICLDVMRAIGREPESLEAFLAELRLARGANAHYDRALIEVESLLASTPGEGSARRLTELMAVLLVASLALRFSPSEMSDAFCATRLEPGWGRTFGSYAGAMETERILARAWPV